MTGNPTSRDYNKASVLEAMLARAPLTRNELIELTSLSKATVSRAVEELQTHGFVVQSGINGGAGRGRRSTYLDVPGTTGHVAGVSFGARNTCVVVSDLRGREVQRVLVPTIGHHDVQAAAAWLVALITDVRKPAQGPLRQVVVAVPGRLRAGTEISGPPEEMKAFEGSWFQQHLADLVAPVVLDSDANAFLLGMLAEDPTLDSGVLLSLSSVLNVASCTGRELVRGRTRAFGDLGVLFSGVAGETLGGLLSTNGLLRFARARGLDLGRIEDLWLQGHQARLRAAVLDAFTTAIVTAINIVAVTADPESVFLVGRLQPLVDEVLPEGRKRLDTCLRVAPQVTAPAQVLGRSVARGAVYAGLEISRSRLRETVLQVRRGHRAPRSAPAF